METKHIYFSEFNAYCKCPLLWDNLYRKKNKVVKPINYRDLVFNGNLNETPSTDNEDVFAKAKAIRQYLSEIDCDMISISGKIFVKNDELTKILKETKLVYSVNDIEISLPTPDVFVSKYDIKEKVILSTMITSSSSFFKTTPNLLSHLQELALEEFCKNSEFDVLKDSFFRIAIKSIKTSSIKMKKAETDEEFEARKAELLRKSKTGTTRAQKQLGESVNEFFSRYKATITHSFDFEPESYRYIDNNIVNNIKCLERDYSSDVINYNNHYCSLCDFNRDGVCPNALGIADD